MSLKVLLCVKGLGSVVFEALRAPFQDRHTTKAEV